MLTGLKWLTGRLERWGGQEVIHLLILLVSYEVNYLVRNRGSSVSTVIRLDNRGSIRIQTGCGISSLLFNEYRRLFSWD